MLKAKKGGGRLLLNDNGVSAWHDEKFMEKGNNDHCTRAWM